MAAVKFDVGHLSTVLCVDAADKMAASGDEDSSLILWTPDGVATGKITAGTGGVNAVRLARSKPEIYAAAGDQIYNYDSRNLKTPLFVYSVNADEVNDLRIGGASAEQYLSAADDSGAIRVVDLKNRRLFKTLRKHDNICTTAAFRPDRPTEIITGGMDCNVVRWDFKRARPLRRFDMNELVDKTDESRFVLNPPLVHSVCISADGAVLAAGLDNAQIKLFDTSGKGVFYKKSLNAHRQGVACVHFAAFGSHVLISGANDSTVAVWKNVAEILTPPKKKKESLDDAAGTSATDTGAADSADDAVKIFEHGSKVNGLSSWKQNGNQILVVDQSKLISAYTLS
ncbi:WD repeat-containing protein 53-like [Tubulanus polymorphus]|uniref:WD repeat-containing protein 53-like n=1 Tax=Tubulanus polymorphus TaxID=672921 RepID=UPI003DA5DEB5